MSWSELLHLWSTHTGLSSLVWILLLMAVLYLARDPAHRLFQQLARSGHRSLRLAAAAVLGSARRMEGRAVAALRAEARHSLGRRSRAELARISDAVHRDLAAYPALHRRLSEQIERIDEDYRASVDAPPQPPEWLDAVAAVARIPAGEDPTVGRLLEDMRVTLERACHNAVLAHRSASHRRHRMLRRMQPHWRRVESHLATLESSIERLERRAQRVDTYMERLGQLHRRGSGLLRRLATSAGSRLLLAVTTTAAAGLAAVLQFELLRGPMGRLLDSSRSLLGMPLADAASGILVAAQLVTALLLADALRYSTLVPGIAELGVRARQRLAVTSGALLAGLVAAGALLASLQAPPAAGLDTVTPLAPDTLLGPLPQPGWIPGAVQGLLALALPGLAALLLLPLEMGFRTVPAVTAGGAAALLYAVSRGLRVAGSLLEGAGRLLVTGYDLLVFLPLKVQRAWHQRRAAQAAVPETASAPPAAQAEGEQTPEPPRRVRSLGSRKRPAPSES